MDPVLTEPGFLREKNRKIRTSLKCLKTIQLFDPSAEVWFYDFLTAGAVDMG